MLHTAENTDLLQPYPTSANQGWYLIMKPGKPTRIDSPHGTISVGVTPHGHDQFLFEQSGKGGGVLIVGYTLLGGQLRCLLLKADRFNMIGGQDYEIPGGFRDPDPNTKNGWGLRVSEALRELEEETGLVAQLKLIDGRPYGGNRSFDVLRSDDHGNVAFSFELTPEQVEFIGRSPNLELMAWPQAMQVVRDGLSLSAMGRLLAELIQNGSISLVANQ